MSAENFDRWQWDGRPPLAASRESGLSFQDILLSMHTQTRKLSGERRLDAPKWALSDVLLRELLTIFLEQRVGIKYPVGTLTERLEKAKQVSLSQRPRQLLTLNSLCEEYLALERGEIWRPAKTDQPRFTGEGWDEYNKLQEVTNRREILATEITGLDTLLKYTEYDGGIATIASAIYLYFRCCLDSVGVAEQVGLQPPHIRQLIFRLSQTAAKLWPESSSENELEPEPLFSFLLQK